MPDFGPIVLVEFSHVESARQTDRQTDRQRRGERKRDRERETCEYECGLGASRAGACAAWYESVVNFGCMVSICNFMSCKHWLGHHTMTIDCYICTG